jgi:hypothetical protein
MGKKKQKEVEYTLHIFPHYDERTRKTSTMFVVQTVKEFTNFNYEILLESGVKGREISFKILGLRTTPLLMPNTGPARGVREYFDLHGTYTLSVIKLNNEKNHFTITVTENGIQIEDRNQRSFIKVLTTPLPLN